METPTLVSFINGISYSETHRKQMSHLLQHLLWGIGLRMRKRRERDDDHPRAVEGVQLSDKTLQGKYKGPKGFSITYQCFTGSSGFFQRS